MSTNFRIWCCIHRRSSYSTTNATLFTYYKLVKMNIRVTYIFSFRANMWTKIVYTNAINRSLINLNFNDDSGDQTIRRKWPRMLLYEYVDMFLCVKPDWRRDHTLLEHRPIILRVLGFLAMRLYYAHTLTCVACVFNDERFTLVVYLLLLLSARQCCWQPKVYQ